METKREQVETTFKSKSWLSNSVDLLLFNLKAMKKMKSGLIIILVFFTMGIVVPIIFVPYYGGVPIYYLTYLVIPTFIILGYTGYNVRNSSLYININSSGLGRKTFYLGQILTILVIGNILTLIFWPLAALVGHFTLYTINWGERMADGTLYAINPFANGAWVLIIYDAEMTIAVTFAIYFCAQSFISNPKTYYIIVTTLVLLTIIFGGIINDYFLQPPGGMSYSHFISETLTEGVDYVKEGDTYYVLNDSWATVETAIWNKHQLDPYGGVFPLGIFIPTLFIPFFGIGQFASAAIGLQSTQHLMWNNESIQLVSNLGTLTPMGDLMANNISGDIMWYDWFGVNPTLGESWMWFMVLWQPYIMITVLFIIGLMLSVIKRK